MTNEEWRTVERNDNYEVSNLGRVRRVTAAKGATAGRILQPYTRKDNGYVQICISRDDKKNIAKLAHIAAEAFIGPRPNGLEVNHKDGIKTNNAADNLEYATRSENMLHAFGTGLASHAGEKNPRAKLTEAKVVDIKQALSEGETVASLSRRYGVCKHAIINIKNGRSWKHILAR